MLLLLLSFLQVLLKAQFLLQAACFVFGGKCYHKQLKITEIKTESMVFFFGFLYFYGKFLFFFNLTYSCIEIFGKFTHKQKLYEYGSKITLSKRENRKSLAKKKKKISRRYSSLPLCSHFHGRLNTGWY